MRSINELFDLLDLIIVRLTLLGLLIRGAHDLIKGIFEKRV